MKLFVIAVCMAAAAMAAPASPGELSARRRMPALQHEETHDQYGQYALRYVTAEGTIVSERGHLVRTPDGKGMVMVVDGETTYISDDGKTYHTRYSAGPDGVKVEGNHLPVAPEPLPVEPVAIPVPFMN